MPQLDPCSGPDTTDTQLFQEAPATTHPVGLLFKATTTHATPLVLLTSRLPCDTRKRVTLIRDTYPSAFVTAYWNNNINCLTTTITSLQPTN